MSSAPPVVVVVSAVVVPLLEVEEVASVGSPVEPDEPDEPDEPELVSEVLAVVVAVAVAVVVAVVVAESELLSSPEQPTKASEIAVNKGTKSLIGYLRLRRRIGSKAHAGARSQVIETATPEASHRIIGASTRR